MRRSLASMALLCFGPVAITSVWRMRALKARSKGGLWRMQRASAL